MIDLSEVVLDADLGENYVILRSQGGQFVAGGWQEDQKQEVPTFGIVTAARANEVNMLPEGDRIKGVMKVYSTARIYGTHADPNPGTSDIIVWRDEKYRVTNVLPYPNRGYWQGLVVRMGGK